MNSALFGEYINHIRQWSVMKCSANHSLKMKLCKVSLKDKNGIKQEQKCKIMTMCSLPCENAFTSQGVEDIQFLVKKSTKTMTRVQPLSLSVLY